MADAKPRPRSEEAIQEAKTQRANKLAQYFRILPCPFTQRVFCYAACLLKWFKAEQQRIELLTQLLEAQKQHLSPPIPHLNAGESGGGEGDEEGDEEEWEWEVEEEEGEEALPTAPTERVSTSVKSARKSMGEVEVRSGHKEIDLSAYDGEEENELEAEEEEKEEEEEIEETRMVAPSEALTPAVTKPCVFRIPFADTTEKRLAYNLAFSAMKYYSILDKIVDEVGFYGEYPDLREEEYLVLVTLYDYTARSYQRRTSTDAEMAVTISDEVDMKSPRYAGRTIIYPPTLESFQTVEQAVINMSVHFAAAVARTRVKEQVGSLHLLLPVEWREAESMAENMPFYGWYNQLLGKSEVVLNWLKENNFTRVKGRLPNALEFAEDEHCPDVFVFNTADRAAIMESQIVRDRFLIIQDKSNLFALHCLLAFMGPGEEVMLVNHPNSLNGIHLEGLLMNKFPTVTPVPTVRIVRQAKENEDPKLIPKCGCRTTRMITDDFLTLNPGGETYRGLRHIVLESMDMKTGVVNPIYYIECENEDLSMFKDMWTPNDNPQKVTKRAELLSKNAVYLKHALKFNQVRTVIFVSHSEDADETETAVQRCVEYANCTLQREVEANATSSRPATSTPGFVCRLPPGIPALAEAEAAISAGEAAPNLITASQCIHFAPSNLHNGFFIACIKKELLLIAQPEVPIDEEENPEGTAVNLNQRKRGRGKNR
ncbi:putative methyltransferase NSUN7 [Echinococcus granulosus]|uniref:Methyltransferase NSUN7 n=1 Tax=Echinococcus granulosus TaxID=6210 RepID=A0A068WDQ1_ECHGR|nr:putative methyltransferase NSUN7 [Echinococcus granulosus]CDS16577.1 methyltransferase NSUN7 [Echinococcus granulosus]